MMDDGKRRKYEVGSLKEVIFTHYALRITHYALRITHYALRITHYSLINAAAFSARARTSAGSAPVQVTWPILRRGRTSGFP
jgi:hypothetical protein